MRDMMDVLGENVLGEMAKPAAGIGFDWGALISATANVAKTGIEQKQAADAKNKASGDATAALSKSIAADALWANNEANLELAEKDPTAKIAAQLMVNSAKKAAVEAAAALKDEGVVKRCEAVQTALKNAAEALQSSPDIAKKAKFNAWMKVAATCPSIAPIEKTPEAVIAKAGGSWITAKKAGLPVWGWGLVTVGSIVALIFIVKAFKK